VLIILSFLIFFKVKAVILKSNPRLLLISLYSRIDFKSNVTTIFLYNLHQARPSAEITLAQIKQSEIFLNDNLINTINKNENNGFSKNIDKTLQNIFDAESRFKMIDKRIRKIHLVITCQRNRKFIVCVYLREGNHRLTREPYEEAIKSLTPWCWLVSRTINPENTEIQ